MKLFFKGERCQTEKCAIEKRNFIPGQHGKDRKPKIVGYGLQLREKQKVRRFYGLLEQPFHNLYEKALKMKGVTGDNLLSMLERRLDNVVYLMGFSLSRGHARQLIGHGHFRINNHRTNIPSALVKVGDVIEFKERTAKSEDMQAVVASNKSKTVPGWLDVDRGNLKGRVLALPTRQDVTLPVEEHLVVELYSK